MQSLNRSQIKNIMHEFKPYTNNKMNMDIVIRNHSILIPYGYAMSNGTYVSPGTTLKYAAYSNNTILSFYSVTVIKSIPKLNIKVNGITTNSHNNVSIVHVPILPGQYSYNIKTLLNASLLKGNNANFIYSIKFGNGTVINHTINNNSLSLSSSYNNIPSTEKVIIKLDTLGNKNYTSVDPTQIIIPTNIYDYVPVTLTNSQSAPLPDPFQQMLTVNSLIYQSYESANLQNVEFFYTNGTIVPSWMESGNSNLNTNTIYWLKLHSNFLPASSSSILYMGFASNTVNLFNTVSTGEAPQLSTTYGEYDDGASVFNYC